MLCCKLQECMYAVLEQGLRVYDPGNSDAIDGSIEGGFLRLTNAQVMLSYIPIFKFFLWHAVVAKERQ